MALRFDTSSYHYKSCRTEQAGLQLRIKEICETRVRYGYRRVHVLLRREGWRVNIKKARKVYNELGLQLRNKRPKRRVKAKLRDNRAEAVGPNDVWAMDFVHDQLALGNKLRILTIVDTHSRFCPATDARFSYRGEDVVQMLEKVCHQIGYPKTIRGDNGSEFISRDLDFWAYANAVTLDFSRLGKPTDRLHRSVQQQAAIGVPERPLVHEPCRRPRKVGGLAQTLQRSPIPQRDRIQRPDCHALSRRRNQPVAVTKPENSIIRRSREGGSNASKKGLWWRLAERSVAGQKHTNT